MYEVATAEFVLLLVNVGEYRDFADFVVFNESHRNRLFGGFLVVVVGESYGALYRCVERGAFGIGDKQFVASRTADPSESLYTVLD